MDWLLLDAGVRRVAQQRIAQAQEQGRFDGLPGRGRPIASLRDGFHERSWVRDFVRRQGLSPAEIGGAANAEGRRAAPGD